jgi:predicted nucleic acid-binding protein
VARVYWDTNLFIYLFEDHPRWADEVLALQQRMRDRGDTLLTGWLTVAEVLAKPRQVGDLRLEQRYRAYFASNEINLVPFDGAAVDAYAHVRATTRVTPADALQLACAAGANADLFVTNDARLHKLSVPGVKFITGLERTP